MSARGRPLPPGMMRHGPPPGAGSSGLPLELAEKEIVAQVAEMDHLVVENRRLAASEMTLRQDLLGAHEEIQRLRAHIRSTQTESDIQIRVLLDKIAKMESDIQAGESIKKELEEAHKEAQSLVAARRDLTSKIQQASQELEKCQNDVKNIPDMLSELDSMKLEHHKLRSTFEQEKRLNLDLVEHMQAMERKLIGMMREVERLRAEVSNAEKRAQAPYVGGAYPTPTPQYPSPVQTNGPYYDPYGRAHGGTGTAAMEGMLPLPCSNTNDPPHTVGVIANPPVSGSGTPSMAWGGSYGSNIPGK